MFSSNPNDFPVEYLPPLIRNAVLEMQINTKFPLPLIISSALGAISLACQNSIDVCLPVGSVSPCSLFMLVVAESGEGKTPVDHYFTRPIIDFEENEARKSEEALIQQKLNREIWTIEHKEIEAAIKKNRKKSLCTDKPEQIDLLNVEFEKLQQKLLDHLSKEPKRQRLCKLIFNNTTPTKIALDLYENWPSAGLFSDEGGSLFRGGALKDLGMLNQLWDGTTLSIDRVSSQSFKVRDKRLTISLMTQPQILNNYLIGRGIEARDIGFLSRCLVAFPLTTKGSRILNNKCQFPGELIRFNNRIAQILIDNKLDVEQGRPRRRLLVFSREAKDLWFNFRNQIECDLNPGRYLADISDSASKMATNLARMAALFHFFLMEEREISAETLGSAIPICTWYIDEFKRLFTKNPEISLEVSDVRELEQFFIRWCENHPGSWRMKKSAIIQYCPAQLRKNAYRRETALNELLRQNKLQIRPEGNTHWVVFNPEVFPIFTYAAAQLPLTPYPYS